MNTIFSPYNISVLIHFNCFPLPLPTSDSLLSKEAIEEFLNIGAIEPDPEAGLGRYRTTPLGKAWVRALCNTPPPVSVFVDEHGRILKP